MVEGGESGIKGWLSGSANPLVPLSRVISDTSSKMVPPLCLIFLSLFPGPSFILIGLMEGITSFAIALAHVISPSVYGFRRDRGGIFPYLLSPVSALLLAAGSTIFSVISARVVSGIGEASRGCDAPLITQGNGKAPGPVSFMSSLAGSVTFGSILAPMLLIIMLVAAIASGAPMLPGFLSGSSALALALAVIALLASVLASLLNKQDAGSGSAPGAVSMGALFGPMRGRGIIIVCLLLSIAALSPFFFLLHVYWDSGLIAMLLCYLAFSLSRSLFSPGLVFLGTFFGVKKALSLGAVCLILSMCVFFYSPSSQIILEVLAFSLLGLSMSVLSSIPSVFISLRLGKEKALPMLSSYRAAAALAGLPGNMIAALLWGIPAFGAPSSILFSLIVGALALGLLVFVLKDD